MDYEDTRERIKINTTGKGKIRVNVKAKDVIGNGGPLSVLGDLLENHNDIVGKMILEAYGEEVVAVAREYLTGERENSEWPALWEKDGDQSNGNWTPEFNKEFRKIERNSEHPLYDTGHLAESIRVTKITKRQVYLGSDDPSARLHEEGGPNPLTHKDGTHLNPIPARPFLLPAFFDVEHDPVFKRNLKKMAEAELMSQIVDAVRGKKKRKK